MDQEGETGLSLLKQNVGGINNLRKNLLFLLTPVSLVSLGLINLSTISVVRIRYRPHMHIILYHNSRSCDRVFIWAEIGTK